jgi:hypothetical protein
LPSFPIVVVELCVVRGGGGGTGDAERTNDRTTERTTERTNERPHRLTD